MRETPFRSLRTGLFGAALLALVALPMAAQGGGELYGDLYIIERDGNGEPVLDAMGCTQPVAIDCAYVPLWWWNHAPARRASRFAPVPEEEEEPCDVDLLLAEQLGLLPREIELGRLSVARSPGQVLDHSYAEAIAKFNEAADVRLDAAGRIEHLLLVDTDHDGQVDHWEWRTIDSPLENLGLYRTLMLNGCLTGLTPEAEALLELRGFGYLVPTQPPPEPIEDADLLRAASFFAAAADKTGYLSIDAVINVNTFVGINEVTGGQVTSYFDFGDYEYDWSSTYPSDLEALLLTFVPQCPTSRMCWAPGLRSIRNEVEFVSSQVCRGGEDVTGEWAWYGGANWFTEAAEHARGVVWFVHNWSIPE